MCVHAHMCISVCERECVYMFHMIFSKEKILTGIRVLSIFQPSNVSTGNKTISLFQRGKVFGAISIAPGGTISSSRQYLSVTENII